jgi:hypothetical protein
MQNILDYLDWRGDITFEQDGLNEVDNLILSSLAYLEFGGIVPPETNPNGISLSDIEKQHSAQIDTFILLDHNPFFKRLPELFHKAARSQRYRGVKLSGYVNEINQKQSEQFSAVVFSMSSNLHFIAFRGTDDTIIGWKEDFQMSFMDEVPAQKQAGIYLNGVCSQLAGRFYAGGHSKGGNLAVYAAAHADKIAGDRIVAIYNNDGPGFQTNILKSAGCQSMLYKINTLIPKSSIVGMLLEHCGGYKVISSNETGIMQHNAFSWEVRGPNFVYEQGLTKNSLNLNLTVRAWLDQLSMEQRSQFVNALFDAIQATGAKTVRELSREKLAIAGAMIKTYSHLDSQTRSHLRNTIDLFFKESRKTINKTIATDLDSLLSKNKLKRTTARYSPGS